MVLREDNHREFKREYVSDVRKEVVAFANTDGGTVLIGVEDDGTPCGVSDIDGVMLQVSSSLKDSIVPDVMPFVEINPIEMEGKDVVKVVVSPGVNKPYYLRDKGLKPSGVYVRKGSASQPVTDEGIRQMIVQSYSSSFEASRSMEQELTFQSLSRALDNRGIEFGEAQMKTLKLIGEDGLYTNLALLLSDQCPATTKIAVFQGTDKEEFRDRKEIRGSIIEQVEEVYRYIDIYNKTKASFSGLNRTDIRDYPEEAVREAWLNCIVHRDYSFSGSTIVNIYDNRIEFVSLGGLVPGLEMKSIFLGVSQTRNPNLAALFYRMRLIESYGTGIGKIERSYHTTIKKPIFEAAMGVFRVTLPNRNEKVCVENRAETKADEKKQIIEFVDANGEISRQKAEEILQSGTTKAFRILKELCVEGKLKTVGNGRRAKYVKP